MELNKFNYKKIIKKEIRRHKKIRGITNFLSYFLIFGLTLVAILFIMWIIVFIFVMGLKSFHFDMLWTNFHYHEISTKGYTGILGPLISTLMLVFVTLCISIPISLLCGILISEYGKNKKWSKFLISFTQICNSVPSIIFAMFGMLFFVIVVHVGKTGFSILTTAFTLTLVTLPMLILATYESLETIPPKLRISSYALGSTKTQTIFKILLPTAITGILTSIFLTILRILGESAPILFTIGGSNFIPHSVFSSGNTLTLLIYSGFKNPESEYFIFAVSFVIFMMVLFFSILLKIINTVFLYHRYNKKIYISHFFKKIYWIHFFVKIRKILMTKLYIFFKIFINKKYH